MEEFHKRVTLPGIQTPTTTAAPEPPPEQIGPYKIEGVLNKGGMSRLYLGLHPETHNPLAIKVLLPKFVSHPEMKVRFLHEAEVISLADHPNIVKLYGQGEWEGGLYIAMEFIQGISLRQFILQQTISLKRALETVLQVADALEHLHAHGVIHRDLKPENILITASGGIKVIDFGIAQLRDEEQKTTGPMGTPIYMSPEQRKDPHSVTAASDIYSLALVLYELVMGRLSHGIVHVALVPKGLQPILAKALQANPKQRYQQITDFTADLGAYLESDAIQRDQRGRGYAQDLAEHLRAAQETLLPQHLPNWPKLQLGIAIHRELDLSGIYYDYLELGQARYGLLFSEPSAKGVEGMLHMAMLQGLVHALCTENRDPVQLMRKVNQIVVSHAIEEIFTCNYLILDPGEQQFHYLSCGYGPLWLTRGANARVEMIPSPNIALGIDPNAEFIATTQNWRVGDTVLLSTLSAAAQSEQILQATLQEFINAPPQTQADAILRRVLRAAPAEPTRRPLAVISIRRIA